MEKGNVARTVRHNKEDRLGIRNNEERRKAVQGVRIGSSTRGKEREQYKG